MKRAVCKNNKCAVYKSECSKASQACCDSPSLSVFPHAGGLCIDVGKKVWSSVKNAKIKDPKNEAIKFAKEAEKLLVRYKNVLPEKHLCSDTRHKYMSYRSSYRKGKRKGKPRALMDAAKGKTAPKKGKTPPKK